MMKLEDVKGLRFHDVDAIMFNEGLRIKAYHEKAKGINEGIWTIEIAKVTVREVRVLFGKNREAGLLKEWNIIEG